MKTVYGVLEGSKHCRTRTKCWLPHFLLFQKCYYLNKLDKDPLSKATCQIW